MSPTSPKPTFRSISAGSSLSPEEAEEARFLRELKGALRQAVAERAEREGMNQAQIADAVGMDAAQFSRALSPDCHVSTRTLFRIAFRLRKRWGFRLDVMVDPGQRRPAAQPPAHAVRVVGSNVSGHPVLATTSSAGTALVSSDEAPRRGGVVKRTLVRA